MPGFSNIHSAELVMLWLVSAFAGAGGGSSGNSQPIMLTHEMLERLAEELDLEVTVVAERLKTLVGDVLRVEVPV